MREFIASNPGLRSRFTTFIHSDDYNSDELAEIFAHFAKSEGLAIPEEAKARVKEICKNMHDTKGSAFGNARDVRNLFERSIKNVAARVAAGDANLEGFTAQDIVG